MRRKIAKCGIAKMRKLFNKSAIPQFAIPQFRNSLGFQVVAGFAEFR